MRVGAAVPVSADAVRHAHLDARAPLALGVVPPIWRARSCMLVRPKPPSGAGWRSGQATAIIWTAAQLPASAVHDRRARLRVAADVGASCAIR
jgi:hypothetical protein